MSDALQAATAWPFAAVFGLFLGSFLGVIAYRWGSADSGLFLKSRSRCPTCHRLLRWYELIPIISFIIQLGWCRRCGAKLSWRYSLVELGTALVVGLAVWTFGVDAMSLLIILLSTMFIVILLVDIDQMIVPDQLLLWSLVVTVGLVIVIEQSATSVIVSNAPWNSWYVGALIYVLVIGGLHLVTRGRGMGFGDVKLGPILGATLGGVGALLGLFLAFVIGSIVGVTLMQHGRATLKSQIPFGPFLLLGWWITVFWGNEIVSWYTNLL